MTRILLVHRNAGEAAERKERLQQLGRALTELRADWSVRRIALPLAAVWSGLWFSRRRS